MEYTLSELMIVASAREIQDGEVIFAGVGNPLLGALLAQKTHAPSAMIATEGGALGPRPKRLILGIGDSACSENAMTVMPLWRLFADQQNGFVDVGMVGGAQVDRYAGHFAAGASAARNIPLLAGVHATVAGDRSRRNASIHPHGLPPQ